MSKNEEVVYGAMTLPRGVRSRFVRDLNGLTVHVLEAGFEPKHRPCVLLLHGFPELAYSWRKVMLPLAQAGFHVIAPDQRGYGRTTGWDDNYDTDLAPFRMLNLAGDALGLVSAFGYRSVAAVVGHDFGSPVAAYCALARPDVFRSVVLMSAPFPGPPALPFDTVDRTPKDGGHDVYADLAALASARKHYHDYYSTRAANSDMRDCPQGIHDFLRAYYHVKSGDNVDNRPYPLRAWTADELAKLPSYYVMDLANDMAATVAPAMPSPAAIAACRWLTDEELGVYSTEFARTGFQGGLNWYRARNTKLNGELQLFSGRTISVPACFIAGTRDWGVQQTPGALEKMQTVCTQFGGVHWIDAAGHWVQQEKPQEVTERLIAFLTN